MDMKVKFTILETQLLMKARGIEVQGKVQQFIDSEVLRLTDPYIPFDSGALKKSGTQNTKIGSGEVVYKTPYARKQYFENKGSGLRGKKWFERSKADHKAQILKGAREMAGARK